MKSFIKVLLVAVGLTFAGAAYGHSDHVHAPKKPVTEDVAKKNAVDSIGVLIKKKKLEDSWSKAEFVSIEKKQFGKKMEWLAIYKNSAVKDVAKQKLYIFMKLSGEFLAANYSGI